MRRGPHAARRRAASARILIAGARAAYVGPALDLAPHRNAAATVAIGLDAPFSLALLTRHAPGQYTTGRIALIPSGTRHHLIGAGDMVFLYLDALSDDQRRLRESALDGAWARLAEDSDAERAHWTADSLCRALGVPDRPAIDPRIAAVVRRIDVRPQDFPRIDFAAARVPLSASRFRALFQAGVGMPFRRYRLWRRMAIVLEAVAAGASLTAAAQEAGFASSAHLSTAFRGMFGITPSRLVEAGARIERANASVPESAAA